MKIHSLLFLIPACLSKKYMTWADFKTVRTKSISGQWLNNDRYVFLDGSVFKNYEKDQSSSDCPTFFDASKIIADNDISVSDWSFGTNDMLLLAGNYEKGYTHYMNTFTYYLFKTATEKLVAKLDGVQKAKWSPDGKRIAFIKDFDIHIYDVGSNSLHQITFDGKENSIFNGITDWLHAVEITDDDCLVFFSPDGQSIAYGQLDQDGVSNFEYQRYIRQEDIYPTMQSLPYPKPGTKLPKISVFHVDVNTISDLTESNFKNYRSEAIPSEEVQSWAADGYYLNMARWVDSVQR